MVGHEVSLVVVVFGNLGVDVGGAELGLLGLLLLRCRGLVVIVVGPADHVFENITIHVRIDLVVRSPGIGFCCHRWVLAELVIEGTGRMKGIYPSRTSRVAPTGNSVPRWEVIRLDSSSHPKR